MLSSCDKVKMLKKNLMAAFKVLSIYNIYTCIHMYDIPKSLLIKGDSCLPRPKTISVASSLGILHIYFF